MAGTDTGVKYITRKMKELVGSGSSEAGRVGTEEALQAEGPRARARLSNDLFAEAKDVKASKDLRRNMAEINRENKDAEGKKAGGSIRSASSRADGIASKGKTRGKIC